MIEKMFGRYNTPAAALDALRDTLAEMNPYHRQEQQTFEKEVSSLREHLDDTQQMLLDRYLAEEERALAERVFYLFWKGVQQNYACFCNPVNVRFLDLDYEQIHQESLMNSFLPHAFENARMKYMASLPEDLAECSEPICSYYAYLETVGYKLAHYYGFQYGNEFLKRIIPGYCPSDVVLWHYRLALEKNLEFRILSL